MIQSILVQEGKKTRNITSAQLVGISKKKLVWIDVENPENNDFTAVRQLIISQHKQRRLDHTIFINGLPLIILEYKDPTNTSADIVTAYNQLGDTNYQRHIPRIFNYNAFLIISDRTQARYGTLTAPF